ncbi:MAG: ABC transporter ATP-binding protein [Chloroflexota bacterium]
MSDSKQPILQVRDLTIDFNTRFGAMRALDGVSFDLYAGETLGLVGESGSGKTVTCLAILRLLPRNATVIRGAITFDGHNLLTLDKGAFRRVRGRAISMILQDPMTSLNPVFEIGWQVMEAVGVQQGLRGESRARKAVDLLRSVQIPAPEARMHDYPHQLSGGMRQRVVGATSLAGNPQILICDEPTTSLDATIQAQYLQLLRDIQRKFGLALIFITHDFGIVAEMCDRIAVMYAGKIQETTGVFELFDYPAHPYTRALLESVPRLGLSGRLPSIPGQPPTPGDRLTGCPFAPRCHFADPNCFVAPPPRADLNDEHWATCWRLQQ